VLAQWPKGVVARLSISPRRSAHDGTTAAGGALYNKITVMTCDLPPPEVQTVSIDPPALTLVMVP